MPLDLIAFSAALLTWFESAAAPLPWRANHDPYRVWLSEIMLQQTQVTTVIPYYERFLSAYPDVHTLANAPLDNMLRRWEGLGYYSRARNLRRAAQEVSTQYGGQFPRTAAELQTLPGIGRYTAAAIASIAYGEHVAVLDGNVIRVLARLYDIGENVQANATQKRLWIDAETLLSGAPEGRAGDHNQAMMELGREICTPRRPLCGQCPVRSFCLANRNGTQESRPVKAAKAKTPEYMVASCVVSRQEAGVDQVLIAQRPAEGLLGGLWEFPAVRCAPGESVESAILRCLGGELRLIATPGGVLTVLRHAFTHFKIRLHAVACTWQSGEPSAGQYTSLRWVALAELDQFAFARADRRVIEFMRDKVKRLF